MSIGFINIVRYCVKQATMESRSPYTMLRRSYVYGLRYV